jgi:hypothetical protein
VGHAHATGSKREIAGDVRGVDTALTIVMGDLSEDARLLRIQVARRV